MIESTYVDMEGRAWSLEEVDAVEYQTIRQLINRANRQKDWDDFDTFWPPVVQALYLGRGMEGKDIIHTTVFRIAQDISARLGIASGQVRCGDYLSDLRLLLAEQFGGNRRALCEAAGLAEDMLSHVFAGRKEFSISALTRALDKIGYVLRVAPKPNTALPAMPKFTQKKAATKKARKKVG